MRIFYRQGTYHVIQEAVRHNALFLEDRDRQYFLKLLSRTAQKYQMTLLCYCFLDECIHLLVQLRSRSKFQPLAYLFRQYSLYYNKQYHRHGALYKNRYQTYLSTESKRPFMIVFLKTNRVESCQYGVHGQQHVRNVVKTAWA